MKILNSVVLENIPQLIIQIIYAFAIGTVTDNVAFAFIASMLSVISTLLSFTIDRRGVGDETVVPIQYQLSLQCTRDPTNAGNELTRAEKMNILTHRGRRLALARQLSTLWETHPKCVEIGSTVLGKRGARIHVVHFVASEDAQSIELCYANHEMQRRVSQILTKHFRL